ncbi:MAG: AAA family ATPase [Candidatus Diapherotrites archaeon]|nr:AAA family ATPase [Candidatus Diapherotrites archaeon]
MIKLKKLEFKNFKSFKKASIPMAEGFTAIAGPNGSGKSNILDGLLFVLGITSMKMLRADKLTELVNHEAEDSTARVSLILKDKEQEFEISRSIDRQGKSVCRMNEKRCGLNEIASFLNEVGIKPTGYNIVVQGDITRIIQMSPKERRGIIDEAAGIREFDEKREEALKELDKVEIKIKEVRIVLNEREQFLRELANEREAANKYLQLTRELKQSKATLFKLEIGELNAENAKFEMKESKIAEELKAFTDQRNEVSQRIAELSAKIEELNNFLISSGEKNFEEFGRVFEEKKSELRISEERISEGKKGLEEFTKREESIHGALKELEERKKQLAEGLKAAAKELKALEEKLKQEASIKEGNINELQNALQKAAKAMEEKRAELRIAEEFAKQDARAITERKNRSAILKSQLESIEERKSQVSGKFKAENAKVKELQGKVSKFESEKVTENLNDSIKKHGILEGELKGLKDSLKELKKAAAKCPVCEASLKESRKKELAENKEKEIAKLESKARTLEEKTREFEEKFSELSQAKAEFNIINSGFQKTESELKHFEERAAELSKESKENEKLLSEIELKNSNAIEQIPKLKQQLGELESEHSKRLEKHNSIQEIEREFQKQSNERLRLEFEEKSSAERIAELEKETPSIEKSSIEIAERIKLESEKARHLGKELQELEIQQKKSLEKNKRWLDEKELLKGKNEEAFAKKQKSEEIIRKQEMQLNELALEKSKNSVRLTDLQEEQKNFIEEKIIENMNLDALRRRIPQIDKELNSLGAINMKALESFENLGREVGEVRAKANKLEEEKISVMDLIQKIEVKRLEVFANCFNKVNENFNKLYFDFFEGKGALRLTDEKSPFEAGLIIEVAHKNNKTLSIDLMSGGERTLAALAFLFAIQFYEPSPFYVFDEADAALDDANSIKFANMIKEISKQSQFIAITHNDVVIKQADQIIGVATNKQKSSSVIGLKVQ